MILLLLLRPPFREKCPNSRRNATFSRTDSFILKRVGKRFLSFMDCSKELIKPVNMVLKAKKTLSNSRRGVENHKIMRKMSCFILKKMDLVHVAGQTISVFVCTCSEPLPLPTRYPVCARGPGGRCAAAPTRSGFVPGGAELFSSPLEAGLEAGCGALVHTTQASHRSKF